MTPITIAEIEVGADVVRVELKYYNGRPVFSAWRFYRHRDNGELKPGRHGLACSAEKLPKIIEAFEAALKRARQERMLP